MRNRYISITLSLVMVSLVLHCFAFAHGTEKHDKMASADSQMMKLHEIMPMFYVASAGLESALGKGEATVVEAEARKIIAAIPDLKKSKPHKNVKQLKIFVKFAASLEETVTYTVDLARKGNIAGAKAAFKKVEEVCASCHAQFRD